MDTKISEENVRHYISEGLLKKAVFEKNIFSALVKNSEESLETADFLMKNNKSFLWIIVCSYYSMYYIANAVIYKNGYKVGKKISHAVTYDALVVFIKNKLEKKLLEDYREAMNEAADIARTESSAIIESFREERDKRSVFQYEMTEPVKRSKAETSLKRAKRFTEALGRLLEESV